MPRRSKPSSDDELYAACFVLHSQNITITEKIAFEKRQKDSSLKNLFSSLHKLSFVGHERIRYHEQEHDPSLPWNDRRLRIETFPCSDKVNDNRSCCFHRRLFYFVDAVFAAALSFAGLVLLLLPCKGVSFLTHIS